MGGECWGCEFTGKECALNREMEDATVTGQSEILSAGRARVGMTRTRALVRAVPHARAPLFTRTTPDGISCDNFA